MKVLLVEDNEDDAFLLTRHLERSGVDLTLSRVETEGALREALKETWDIILSDYNLPGFTGERVLQIVRARRPEIPLIMVSGAVGEEVAAATMRSGASDFFVKGQIDRLVPAIHRELAAASHRRRSEEAESRALRAEDLLALVSQLVQEMPIGVTVFRYVEDAGDYVCVDSNAAASVLGLFKEAIGRVLSELTNAAPKEVLDAVYQVIEHGEQVNLENLVLGYENVRAVKVLPFGGDSIGILSEDITRRVRLESQMRAAQRMEAVGRLAGGVAHDFNNLLTAIFSFGRFAQESLHPEDPAYADIDQVLKAGEHAERLTRQLLAFSRKKNVEPRVLSVTECIRDMQKMLRRIIGEDVDMKVTLDNDLRCTRIDPGALEQVVVNLVVNARDAMPGGGTLEICTENTVVAAGDSAKRGAHMPPGDYVRVRVRDTGCGMTPETQRQIFEPFFTTKGEGEGTGLGLSTCYGIIKQADGFIWVDSTPNAGSTFEILFPGVDEQADAADANGGTIDVRGDERVLVVEDNDQVRGLAVRALKSFGYHVFEAANGGEAILLGEDPDVSIDLLLTDVVMPRMSGKKVALRLARTHPDMKVLYMSGYTANKIDKHGVLEEGVTLLQKPFTPDKLGEIVRQVIDSKGNRVASGDLKSILIIDDDPVVTTSMKRLFEQSYQTTTATNAVAALEITRDRTFDVILVDVVMPGIDGIRLFHMLEEQNAELAHRVIFVSGAGDAKKVGELNRPLLRKPIDVEALEQAVASIQS